MTIHDSGRDLVIHGESLAGEEWPETFLRLYQELLPPGAPGRKLVYAQHRGPGRGMATNKVITCYRDATGRLATDHPLILRTRPPQF
jgi:hypothetical protein